MRTPRVIPADTDPIVVPVTRDDFLTEPAEPPLTDDPGNALYPGRMTAFPDTPDEDLF
jgi:hypothetical protein